MTICTADRKTNYIFEEIKRNITPSIVEDNVTISLFFIQFPYLFITNMYNVRSSIARNIESCISRFGESIALSTQRPQAAIRSRARSKKEPKGCRTKRAMKGRCRYAKNALDDRQFLSSRRHRHQLKIQFEKSNNTAQFARKCISRSSCDGIVRRMDTMRPIGGTTPDFYSGRRPRLFSTTAVHYRRRGNPSICPYFLSSCNSFFHRRRFGCTRARYNRRRVTACPICIPRSKSGRPR